MEPADLDAAGVVGDLRAKVSGQRWTPSPPPESDLTPMLTDPALAYLHRHWALKRTLEPLRRRFPVVGLRGAARALLNRAAFEALRPYLDEEQELLAHAVRLLDALARRCDAMAESHAAELDAIRADMVDLAARLPERHRGG